MSNGDKDRIILSIGGSLIATDHGINTDFLSRLNKFIRQKIASNKSIQFFLVVGGGTTARTYRDAGREVIGHELTREDLDWLGLHATRLNAHLVRTIFRDIAHQSIIKDYSIILKPAEQVTIAAGWKPGWSTDYCAVLLCEDYHTDLVINLTNTSSVYDRDPKEAGAKAIEKMSWDEFRKLVGDEWSPGMHAPFDPIAARKAQEIGAKVVVLGEDFDNLSDYLEGKKFVGTVIE